MWTLTSNLVACGRRLQESERVALETEEQGSGILNSLRRQREQIEGSRDMVCSILFFYGAFLLWRLSYLHSTFMASCATILLDPLAMLCFPAPVPHISMPGIPFTLDYW
jgi:hypothetical protein